MMDVTDIGQSVPMGSPMDPMDHPADSGHNDGYNPGRVQMAGDVVSGNFPQSGLGGGANQIRNQGAMRDIADRGAKAVDTTNLKLIRPK